MIRARTGEERRAVIEGLRALADFLDDHPEVPLCPSSEPLAVFPEGDDTECFADIDRVAALIGVAPKRRGDHYVAEREFGPAGSEVVLGYVAIPADSHARYTAERSYAGSVHPEEDGASGG
ncbi:hypothetical protein [Nocardiopsis potens]|uniref:hypothetical protein n=1 Tax=Nocardiopsis potens TaxID=1246458 RepID=UPI000345D82F|nr:hypothetical protein [Nocardiopsis potens]